MSEDANTLIRYYEGLWSKQANFRMMWQTTAQFVLPAWDNFIGEWSEGLNRNYRIFASRPLIALNRFAAAMESLLTPRQSLWAKLKAKDPKINRIPAVKRWFDEVNGKLFQARYHPQANFAGQMDECYVSLGAFGNGHPFVDEVVGRSLRYRSIPLNELVWAVNHQGYVDTTFRKFRYTAKQAIQHWGRDRVPKSVREIYEQRSPYEEIEFLHVVRPSDDYLPGAYGHRGMPFECWYIHLDSKEIIEKSGYRCFPGGVFRYRVAPRETYGRGPAQDCFPDVRTLNEQRKTEMRAGQKAVDPPVLLHEDSVVTPFNQRSAAANYGMVNADGKPLAVAFESKGNFQVAKELREELHQGIDDTFLVTIFKLLWDNPNMTATAALLIAQEKAEMIAPVMGRQQSEGLGQVIHREIDVLSEAGQLPPPPREYRDSEGGFEVEYSSPMARALKAEEGTAIMNTVSDLAQMVQVDPSVRFKFDFHQAFERMTEVRGCPAELVLSDDDATALMEHAAQQQQMAQGAQGAPAITQGVLNLAKAAQISGQGAGSPVPGAAGGAAPGAAAGAAGAAV